MTRLLLAIAAVVALLCAGCGVHPLGTHDVALAYRGEGTATVPRGLAALVRQRLAAAQITADIVGTADGVRVTVDRDEAPVVGELLEWRGGIAIYAPKAGRTAPSGQLDEVAEGAPLADLSEGVAQVASSDGRSIAIHLTPAAAREVTELMRARPGAPLVVARGKSVLRVAPLEGDPIVVPLGDDLRAYARARVQRSLLSTPTLPRLVRVDSRDLPVDLGLAASALVVPFALSLAWLFFVRRFDRAHPEPWPVVAATFALGGLGVLPAALAEIGWSRVSQWTDPSLITMGGQLAALPLAIAVFALVVGLSEEGAKFFGAWSLAFHRREFDEPVDGMIYGAASALGFAAIENVKYFAIGRFGPVLVVVRTFLSIPAHLFFGAIWGYALGQRLLRPRLRLALFVALAAIAHGAFDALLSTEGTQGVALLLNLGLASLFVHLLRRSLRHGIVTGVAPIDPARRVMVTVGSPLAFMGCVIALHVLAACIFAASATIEGSHERVGVLFVLGMAALVTMLALVAYGLSRTMPLDVVLDDRGVTFAGAARAWGTLRGIEKKSDGLQVRSTAGDLWIGPASDALLEPIARAIASRIGPA